MHTTMAKFPDAPTAEEKTALASYIHLFARLYPWYVFHFLLTSLPSPFPQISVLITACQYREKASNKTNFGPLKLFFRLSGECATHFQQILKKFPPQVSTRSTAAAWACHLHNEVNKSLLKELFDCSKIGDFYDCGCADDEPEKSKEGGRIELKVERTGG